MTISLSFWTGKDLSSNKVHRPVPYTVTYHELEVCTWTRVTQTDNKKGMRGDSITRNKD